MYLPHTAVLALQPKASNLLRSVADSAHVSTAALRKCSLSTTVSNVRYGTYTAGVTQLRHEACVVFLSFEIGRQTPDSDQRIKELEVRVGVHTAKKSAATATAAAAAAATDMAASSSSSSSLGLPDSGEDGQARSGATPPTPSAASSSSSSAAATTTGGGPPALEIRTRHPVAGHSRPSTLERSQTVKVGAEVGYQAAGVGASAGYEAKTSREVSDWGRLESWPEGARAVYWRLSENRMLKDGVPRALECAVVIKTDGLAFGLLVDVEAKMPFMGGLWFKSPKTQVLVDESLVRRRAGKAGEDDVLQDMDSVGFDEWMKSQITNEWMEGSA